MRIVLKLLSILHNNFPPLQTCLDEQERRHP